MKCSKCGTVVEDGSKFCPNCGSPIESTNQEPQFGAQSTPSFGAQETPTFGAESSTTADETKQQSENSMSNTEKTEFGANAEREKTKTNLTSNAKGIVSRNLKLQPQDFWIKYYIISFIFALLSYMASSFGGLQYLFIILNFILYPITESILQEGTKMLGINYIGNALITNAETPGILVVIILVIKFIYKMFIWSFSWIVGPLGAIYMNHLGKKMGL
ncbi:zinc-ribbon domain-containing protein [Staphylococcus debuckii]|uniref:zinc-ribbon domain-containing protein n=1 Tax=Staphylococcus debuckii TaxID=2044912 RepID=UPI000F4348FA|nr:zinc-ribbon domain-containing protein [Staphylococcus debuckii]AYU54695.1 zinc-ribbon domain-containing protein [Staphylococcus debuckii]